MNIYVNESVFDWDVKKCTIEPQGSEWEKSYIYVNHAQSLLAIADNGNFYIDIISNLKRSIDHRLKLLSKYYDIKHISKLFGVKGSFDTLSKLSLVRRLMVNKLIELRNNIEHQFSEAPSHDRCEEYIEFTWYFLRSTDSWAKEVHSDIYFEHPNISHYFIELDLNIENGWNIEFSAWLPKEMYSEGERNKFYELEVKKLEFGHQFSSKLESDPDLNSDGHWIALKQDDLHINSVLVQSHELKRRIIKEYFAKI
ncbi:hypothetical protein [Vibrio lentus]|uniref:hypothetical protein n=1 Tax=Vibrio lentus TaxID=136468 RepID=UPI00178C8704|nr:hypothetical protein [Vibrio lentus]MDN3630677.1 hypothetical protein [Vibrio lentus]